MASTTLAPPVYTNVLVSSLDANKKDQNGFTEDRMDAFLQRMDKMIALNERSSVTIYQRRFITADIANPAPIGLFAFALATAFYMTTQAKIVEQSSQFIGFTFGMFLGGLTMVVAGFLELLRKNSLGATAFCVYGSFWITVGVYGTIRAAGIFFLDAPNGEQALTILMGFASFVFMIVSLAANLIQPLLFGNLAIMFFLLAGGFQNTTCARVAGWYGIWTSGVAFYAAAAALFRDMWGIEVLPQLFTKQFFATERIWFPRARVSKDGDVEDGLTHKGHMN